MWRDTFSQNQRRRNDDVGIVGGSDLLVLLMLVQTLRLLNALNSEDRGLKVRFSLATIVFETFELILCQMLLSQGKKRTFKPLSSLFRAFSNLKEWHYTQRKIILELIMHFIADTDTDENYSGIHFS